MGASMVNANDGGFFDSTIQRFRVVRNSPAHKTRKKLGYDDEDAIIWDVFTQEDDLQKAERMLIDYPTTQAQRIKALVQAAQQKHRHARKVIDKPT